MWGLLLIRGKRRRWSLTLSAHKPPSHHRAQVRLNSSQNGRFCIGFEGLTKKRPGESRSIVEQCLRSFFEHVPIYLEASSYLLFRRDECGPSDHLTQIGRCPPFCRVNRSLEQPIVQVTHAEASSVQAEEPASALFVWRPYLHSGVHSARSLC